MKKKCTIFSMVTLFFLVYTFAYSGIYDKFFHVKTDKFLNQENIFIEIEKIEKTDNTRRHNRLEVGYVSGVVICRDGSGKLYATNSICRDKF